MPDNTRNTQKRQTIQKIQIILLFWSFLTGMIHKKNYYKNTHKPLLVKYTKKYKNIPRKLPNATKTTTRTKKVYQNTTNIPLLKKTSCSKNY